MSLGEVRGENSVYSIKTNNYSVYNFLVGSGSLAAMAVFERSYRPNMEVTALFNHCDSY